MLAQVTALLAHLAEHEAPFSIRGRDDLAGLALGRETDASRSREARRIRRALLEHAFRLGPARIGAEETGRLISLLTDSVDEAVSHIVEAHKVMTDQRLKDTE